MNWLKENWFKVAVILLGVWFLPILSSIGLSNHFSIDVCLQQASGLPALPKDCW